MGFGGPVGLDYTPFISVTQARGWDLDLAIELLSAIEDVCLEHAYREKN